MPLLRVSTTVDSSASEAAVTAAIKGLAGLADLKREEIESYYWWEGKVQNDDEVRLSWTTEAALDEVVRTVGAAHSYDVPMIIAHGDEPAADRRHCKGVVAVGGAPQLSAAALAAALAESRLVACAQVSKLDGALAVKTVADAKAAVEALVRGRAAAAGGAAVEVEWTGIVGNAPYLQWLEEETVAVIGFDKAPPVADAPPECRE